MERPTVIARAAKKMAVTLPQPMSVLGFNVHPFDSYGQAVDCADQAIETGHKMLWVAINPEKLCRAEKDSRLAEVLRQADVGLCDGIGIVIASRLLCGRGMPRCTGCDLFFHLVARAAERGWRVFLLGASEESNAKASAELTARHPALQIVGRRDGYFQDSADVVRQINDAHADVLFAAMGSPRQELWLAEHRHVVNAAFCMGVGGSFDIASGQARRAPRALQRIGGEYVFQLVFRPGWSPRVRWRRTLARLSFLARVAGLRLRGQAQP